MCEIENGILASFMGVVVDGLDGFKMA